MSPPGAQDMGLSAPYLPVTGAEATQEPHGPPWPQTPPFLIYLSPELSIVLSLESSARALLSVFCLF